MKPLATKLMELAEYAPMSAGTRSKLRDIALQVDEAERARETIAKASGGVMRAMLDELSSEPTPALGFGIAILQGCVRDWMREEGYGFEDAIMRVARDCELRSEAIEALRNSFKSSVALCDECGHTEPNTHHGNCSKSRTNPGRDGKLHHMLCKVIVTGGLEGPCDCVPQPFLCGKHGVHFGDCSKCAAG